MATTTNLGDYRTWDAATGTRRYVTDSELTTVGVVDLDNPEKAHLIRNDDPADRAPVFIPSDEPTVSQEIAAIMYEHTHQEGNQ